MNNDISTLDSQNPFFAQYGVSLPEQNETTLCEIHSTLLHLNNTSHDEFVLGKYREIGGVLYRNIMANISNKHSMIAFKHPFQHPGWQSAFSSKLPQSLKASLSSILPNINDTMDWHIPTKHIAWHPYLHMFALAIDATVYFYDMNSESWSSVTLKNSDYQKEITCLQWKPHAGSTLAVGTKDGICIWTMTERDELKSKRSDIPSNNNNINMERVPVQDVWFQYLSTSNHSNITTISWSPDGKYLASGGLSSKGFVVWDIAKATETPIQQSNLGTTLIKWSPDGSRVFQATTDTSFCVWETMTWTHQRWTKFPSYCQTACWSPDSNYLLVAIAGDTRLYGFFFPHRKEGRLAKVFPSLVDSDKTDSIRQIEWDSTGERVAVSFNGNNSDLIALLRANELDLVPIGFIRGPKGKTGTNGCETHQFRPDFPRGALLTVCWQNGKLSFYPLFFNTLSSAANLSTVS